MSENKSAMVVQNNGPDRFALEPRNFAEGMQMARIVAHTQLYGVKSAEDAFVRMATGMALGLSAPQSLRGLFVISGKVGISADLMMGLALRHPECRYFRCVETTADRATFATQRGDDPETSLSFTMDDAKRAGLNSNAMYGKYPAQMLRARCIAGLARLVYPEVMHGLYVPEEISEGKTAREEEGAPPIVEQSPEPPPAAPPSPSKPSPAPEALVSAARAASTVEQAEASIKVLAQFDAKSRAEGWFALARVSDNLDDVRDRARADINHPRFLADMAKVIDEREARDMGEPGDETGAAA